MATIGFIGLGNMGAPMAANLLKAQHRIAGYDIVNAARSALAEKLGLPAQTLFDICSKSTSQCWAMTGYCPVPGPVPAAPSNRNYAPGFTAANMLKDLRLAQQAAGATAAATPLGAAAANLYQLFVDGGAGGLDFSGIYRLIGKSDDKT